MSKLLDYNSLKNLNYEKLGLKCGIEIHQQLDTGKLFCDCPTKIVDNSSLNREVERSLRFSLSETGEVDKAALSEFKKQKKNIYIFNNEVACLVDLDEEPPRAPNSRAIDTILGISKVLKLKNFKRIQFMRKIIIDGSITSGFQRTALLGIGGELKTKNCKVTIDAMNLEEDSCRIIERGDSKNKFSLDRQGIPLVEITTGPQIKTPDEAKEVASELGNILRSFPFVKRGLGTIRQDINVSIEGGSRIEIKGAQNLKLLPKIVENEVKRQLILISIIDELKERKITKDNFSEDKIYDISDICLNSNSELLNKILSTKGSKALAIKLIGMKEILGINIQDGVRFGKEISQRNSHHYPQIKGLFHLDEMPNYGLENSDIDNIRKELDMKENDSFIIIANGESIARDSLKNIIEIISSMISEVPSEVRQVDPKGVETKFLRPMPGSARMYPETDIPDINITDKVLNSIEIPEMFNKRLERLSKELNLDIHRTEEVLEKLSEKEIKRLLKVSKKSAQSLYSIVFEIPKDIKKRDKIEPVDLRYELLEDLLRESSNLSQQVIRDVFISLYKDKLDSVSNLKGYLEEKGLLKEEVSDEELESVLREVAKENEGAPFGALMGQAMKKLNGNVDGKRISEILKRIS